MQILGNVVKLEEVRDMKGEVKWKTVQILSLNMVKVILSNISFVNCGFLLRRNWNKVQIEKKKGHSKKPVVLNIRFKIV